MMELFVNTKGKLILIYNNIELQITGLFHNVLDFDYITNYNSLNSKIQKNNTSGYRGVRFDETLNKWRAVIVANMKIVSLGCFSDIEDAARAYDEAAKKYHGEYAQLNFPLNI